MNAEFQDGLAPGLTAHGQSAPTLERDGQAEQKSPDSSVNEYDTEFATSLLTDESPIRQSPPEPPVNQVQPLPFSFTGSGREYFRIWIVNLMLNVLTLGIFSPWAKVRRMQYFYRNTHMGDASFDFHGSPIAILKGRIIGFGLFAAYTIAGQTDPIKALGVLLFVGAIMPFLLTKSFRFRLANTSYRGLRFGFKGSVLGAYGVYLALPLMTMFTMYLLVPLAHQRIKAYQHSNSLFGQTSFSFLAREGGFFRIYLYALLWILAMMFSIGIVASIVMFAISSNLKGEQLFMAIFFTIYFGVILSSLLVGPFITARTQNLVWNGTRLDRHGFSCTLRARSMAWIVFSNFFLTVVTLGLYKPFAAIRLARYRIENLSFIAVGSMDNFIAGEQQKAGAAGMETADFFDIDVGF